MSRKLLFVFFSSVCLASIGCCHRCYDSYGYTVPAVGTPISNGCSSCVTTPAVTTYSAPSPTLAPGQ